MPSTKILFILNPVTANICIAKLRDLSQQHLNKGLFDTSIILTKHEGHARELARQAAGEDTDIIVAVGGDGTVNEVSSSLTGTDKTLGIIPAGSGNGLARHLKIPINYVKALHIINQRHTINIDTASVNGRHFVSIAGIGFDARVANAYRKTPKRGFGAYFRLTMKQYLHYKPQLFRLRFDGREIEREALFVSFANAGQFGYNTIIAPHASLHDGMLDVVVVRKFPFSAIPRIIKLLYQGKIDLSEYTENYRVKELVAVRERGKRVNIDGEAIRMGNELHFKVHPGLLKVLAPES